MIRHDFNKAKVRFIFASALAVVFVTGVSLLCLFGVFKIIEPAIGLSFIRFIMLIVCIVILTYSVPVMKDMPSYISSKLDEFDCEDTSVIGFRSKRIANDRTTPCVRC